MSEPKALDLDQVLDAAQAGDVDARFRLGRHYLAVSEFGRARRWLSRAANQGHGGAMVELGRIQLEGLGLPRSPSDAAERFRAAAQADSAEGHYEFATLLYRGSGIDENREQAAKHLTRSARQGHPPALRTRAFLHAEVGEEEWAARCLLAAAEGGDRVAQNAIAQRLAQGQGLDQDPAAAAWWATRARENGSYCQQQFHELALDPLPSEAPQTSGFDPAEVLEVEFSDIPTHPADIPQADKSVRIYGSIYRHEECEYLIETAAPYLMPSFVVNPQTGKPIKNPVRTSEGWSFHPTQEDIAILRIKERLTRQTGLPVQHAEPFSLLRYQSGQEYRRHFDWIDPASGEAEQEIGRYGQRQRTIFSYLRTVPEGGETEFPRLDLKVACIEGRAVEFSNVLEDGRPDPESLHASLPVIRGEKWLATLWIRERPIQQ